jgi:hypothetical protein
MGRYALLIGTGQYTDPELSPLWSPAEDVARLEQVLNDPDIGFFDHVLVCVDRPAAELLLAVEEITSDRQPDDLVLIYVSGHGVTDRRGRLHYATSNTNLKRLASSSMPVPFLMDQMENSNAQARVFILDCCFSGSLAEGFTAKSAPGSLLAGQVGRGYVVMTATDSLEFAYEDGIRSIFTEALVSAFTDPAADRDGDGLISTTDLYDHIYPVVTGQADQKPNYFAVGVEGKVILGRAGKSGTSVGTSVAIEKPRSDPLPSWQDLSRGLITTAEAHGVDLTQWAAADGPAAMPNTRLDTTTQTADIDMWATRLLAVDSRALPAVFELLADAGSRGTGARGELTIVGRGCERAWIALANGWVGEARTNFAAAVKAEPLDVAGWWGMGLCHVQAGSWIRAGEAFLKAARYAAPTARQLHVGASLLAASALELAADPRATQSLREALQVSGSSGQLMAALAVRIDDAELLSDALIIDPALALALAARGKGDSEATEWATQYLLLCFTELTQARDRLRELVGDVPELSGLLNTVEGTSIALGEPLTGVAKLWAACTAAGATLRTVIAARSRVGGTTVVKQAFLPATLTIEEVEAAKPGRPPQEPSGRWGVRRADWEAYQRALDAHSRAALRYRHKRLDYLQYERERDAATARADRTVAAVLKVCDDVLGRVQLGDPSTLATVLPILVHESS